MTDRDEVLDWLDGHAEDMAEFLVRFGNVPSPRGHERPASDFLFEWLEDNGVRARTQRVVSDRENVIGTLPGTGNNRASRIVFNAHLDTAYGNRTLEEHVLPEINRAHRAAWRDGDLLFGNAVVNDKGPMAGFLWAALAFSETDIQPDADVILSATVGEIGGTEIDEFQGSRYLGSGIGARRLVDGGVTGDFAIVAETTDFAIARMECGLAWFKITIRGTPTYQPRLERTEGEDRFSDHPGAIPAAVKAIGILEGWGDEYRAANTVEFDHGTMRPSAGVGAMKSGNPHAPMVSPGSATLYLDVRLPPGRSPEYVRSDIESELAGAGIDATVESYLFRRGYIADKEAAPLVTGIERAHQALFDTTPPRPHPAITSMWRDINVFNEVGIPAVTIGPPRRSETVNGTVYPCLELEDLLNAAKLYATVITELCIAEHSA